MSGGSGSSSTTSSTEALRSSPGLRARVALAYASFVLVGISAGVGGVALPAQMADYGVDRAAIGMTFFTFSGGFLLAGVTTGHLIGRLGVRLALVLGGAGFITIALVTAARPPFALFVLLSLPAGYASGVLESVLQAYLADLPRAAVRMGRLHAFFGLGALGGPLLASRLLVSLEWTSIWLVQAVVCVPIVIGFATLLHRDGEPRPDGDGPRTPAGAPGGPVPAPVPVPAPSEPVTAPGAPARPGGEGLLLSTVRQPAVLLGGAMLATYVGLEVSVGNWAFSFLVEERGQGTLAAGNMISGYWGGLTLGRFVISPAAARAGWTEVRTTTACLLGVVVATVLVWLVPGTVAAAAGLALVGFFLGPIFPNTMAAAPRLTDAARIPTAIGVLNGVSVIGGSALPWLAGVLIQKVALWTLLPFAALLAVLQLLIWGGLARRFRPVPGPAAS